MRLTVRLKSVRIENFKNVTCGALTMEQPRKPCPASVLGLYGQNGSGKTALIDALQLLKLALSGQPVPARFADAVNVDAEYASFAFEMDISTQDGDGVYCVVYSFRLKGAEENSVQYENLETQASVQLVAEAGAVFGSSSNRKALLFDEVLKCSYSSKEKNWKLQPLIDASRNPSANAVFFPETKFDILTGKNREAVTDLLVAKKLTASTSRSFIFSRELLDFIWRNCEEKSYADPLRSLAEFGKTGLFVIDASASGLIYLNALPIPFRYDEDNRKTVGFISLSLNDATPLPEKILDMVRNMVSSMNIVLRQLVPGLTVSLRTIGSQVGADNQAYVRVQLFSRKNSREIPLYCESEGIKKIISYLQLLIMAYNHSGITVAIDELDSGVFEYLLGELLQIFSENGKGQLIFTSHNLRPLETIEREFIAFTTVNPQKRYVRLNNLKANHNLRDTYYRNILLGAYPEELYDPTNNSEIAFAFRAADGFRSVKGCENNGD